MSACNSVFKKADKGAAVLVAQVLLVLFLVRVSSKSSQMSRGMGHHSIVDAGIPLQGIDPVRLVTSDTFDNLQSGQGPEVVAGTTAGLYIQLVPIPFLHRDQQRSQR